MCQQPASCILFSKIAGVIRCYMSRNACQEFGERSNFILIVVRYVCCLRVSKGCMCHGKGGIDISLSVPIVPNPGYWLLIHDCCQPAPFARCGSMSAIVGFD